MSPVETIFCRRQIHDEIAARVRRRPVIQLELHAVDGHRFLVLGHDLIGQSVGRRGAASAGGQRGFLLFLVVLRAR